MTALVATDLDGTVMFSLAGPPAGALTVDPVADTYMTSAVVAGWSRLATAGVLVPVTTRTVDQYQRLMLPGPPPRYAVVGNGTRLLVRGESDPTWQRAVRKDLVAAGAGFQTVWKQAVRWRSGRAFRLVRGVDEAFVYLAAERRDSWLVAFAHEASAWADQRGWRASLQGRKLYLVPVALDKAAAVARLAARLGTDEVFAGGDSLLDAQMLRSASASIRPNHGELNQTGFSAPNCQATVEGGTPAGDEIVAWYLSRAGLGDG
ncbi:MAG: HAD family hydrolase [Dactylosporangium sp.]|nr:hypothetical protein [Dactylosporangium sp.]NNJ62681.1 HAD family hydrolase [Dactylosporangium sp.]